MTTAIKLVLFDLDETLIRHTASFEAVFAQTFEQFSDDLAPITAPEFLEAFWPKMLDVWHMMIAGDLNGKAGRHHAFRNTLRMLEADVDLAEAMCEAGDRGLVLASNPAPDVEHTLKTLREAGITIGVVTNGFDDLQRRKLKHHGLDALTDFQLVSESEQSHKPDTLIFERAVTRAACSPEETLFVGDTLGTDIEGALAAGMHAAHLSDGIVALIEDRYHPIDDLSDVLALLDRL
jgi:putative hydrolase of the HAD superfamily